MIARKRPIQIAAAALALALAGGAAAQGSAPSKPAASASARPSASASAKKGDAKAGPSASSAPSGALPPGHPAVGGPAGGADAPSDGRLPPGHPAVGEGQLPDGHPNVQGQLPAGHPAVDDSGEGDDDAEPAPPPHHGSGNAAGLFEPPPDTVEEDASLPVGTIVATVRDAQNRPMPRAKVALGILHNSVAKGESRDRIARDADEAGTVRFDGLEIGANVSYHVTTERGPATFGAMPFGLGDKSGKSVVVHSYEVSTQLDNVLVGLQSIVYVSLKEDSVSIENLYLVYNVGPVAWVPDNVTIALPKGFRAYNRPDSMEGTRFDEVYGVGAGLRGTYGPGRHEVSFRYQVPLEGSERQTIRLEMPPHVAQARVMVESSKNMGLEVANFPMAQRTQSRDGKRLLVTERQVSRAEGGLQVLDVTLTGLPTPGPGRWIAVGLAALALTLGGGYVLRRRDLDPLDDEEARLDLLEAQRALLDEIVELERAHRAGEIGPKTYARVRAGLLDALGRVAVRLEESRPRRRRATAAA